MLIVQRDARSEASVLAIVAKGGAFRTSAARMPWMAAGPRSRRGFTNVAHSPVISPDGSTWTTATSMIR
jgi:hypothetical protein